MKNTYKAPVVEIKMIDKKDVITTSNELPGMPGDA
jgi:hypothetical protein